MSEFTEKTIELMEMLPEDEQKFALEIIKKLVLAWDPDFSKLTNREKNALENAKSENSISLNILNWESLQELDIE